MSKPKILCLHGYATNADFMKIQAKSFIKHLSNDAQFIFVDGPFTTLQSFVLDQKVIDRIKGQYRAWTPNVLIQEKDQKFQTQFDKLRIAFQKASDHYDGIMGFSQGANLIYFLLRMQAQGKIKWKILEGIKFVINLNGMHINYQTYLPKNIDQIEIPSFHVTSYQDPIYSVSILHTTKYKNPLIHIHQYGHKFPNLGLTEVKLLKKFIRQNSGKNSSKKPNYQILSLSNL